MTLDNIKSLLSSFRLEIISLYPPKFKLVDLNPSDNVACDGILEYDTVSKTFKLSLNMNIKFQ